MEAYGLGDRLVEMKYFTYTEAADALQKGEIDAMFCTAGVQTTVLEELTRQCEIRFLNVDGEGAGRLLSAYPAYETYVIPGRYLFRTGRGSLHGRCESTSSGQ